jgi:hypothetical protein
LHFYFNFSFKFSNIQKSRRRFNIAARSARISAPNPRDIPEELRVWPSNQKLRPLGIGNDERQIIDDFYLLYEEKRENMEPFLVFSNLTGFYIL